MPLVFPNNPTIGQTYQSGSSSIFIFNGEAWDTQNANPQVTATASYATTAGSLVGSRATYIFAYNNGGQSIFSGLPGLALTNWVNTTAINAGEWNPTTGVFTATKTGTYCFTINLTFSSVIDNINSEYSANISKNGVFFGQSRIFVPITQTVASFKQTNVGTAIFSVVPGDTVTFIAMHFTGANRSLHTNGNTITIQELPTSIQR
jgi:hypothetical protein